MRSWRGAYTKKRDQGKEKIYEVNEDKTDEIEFNGYVKGLRDKARRLE